jgi:ferredoxin
MKSQLVARISLFTTMFSVTKSFLVPPSSIRPHLRALQSRHHTYYSAIRLTSSSSNTNNGCEIDNLDEVNVTFKTSSNDKNIPIQKGEILRSAMLKRGISPHNGRSRLINCRGLGTCGTCAVEVVPDESDDAIEPKERNTKERLRLKFPPHGSSDQSSNLRLACQIQVNGDVSVKKRTGFWGQDTGDLAEEFESELWFGDLEYIMDDKSPSQKAD